MNLDWHKESVYKIENTILLFSERKAKLRNAQ